MGLYAVLIYSNEKSWESADESVTTEVMEGHNKFGATHGATIRAVTLESAEHRHVHPEGREGRGQGHRRPVRRDQGGPRWVLRHRGEGP